MNTITVDQMILNTLNKAQQEAVSSPLIPQLVLAGAGSGKTRVLTERFAWLVQAEHFSPSQIMAVTFTNKAAREMRERIEERLRLSARSLWIGTFHGLCHRILRMHAADAGLIEHFQILDSDDQKQVVKRTIAALNLDEHRYPVKDLQWFINKQKEEGKLPSDVVIHDAVTKTKAMVYQAYQEAAARMGVIDFADLIHKTHRLFLTRPDVLDQFRKRFRAVLVDEFQDTNALQYAWLNVLAKEADTVMIVGDDDQSIYGWRGAQVENIQRFTRDFPNTVITRLEQNYRSTGTILNAANALIEKNKGRFGKSLWTDGKDGEPIKLFGAFGDGDETFFVVNRIRDLVQQGFRYKDIAILVRSNAQTRLFEETLMQFGIAYRVYGGLRFFDRAEIKDALAYLRLLLNQDDDASFERVINTPTRGIGDRTMTVIREHAKQNNASLWQSMHRLVEEGQFAARTHEALSRFIRLIESMKVNALAMNLPEQFTHVIHETRLIEFYREEKGSKSITRVENLEELINAAHQFEQENLESELPPLALFLAYAALESGEDQAGASDDAVQLMTLHSSKGLEFPVVFLAGCEEELFPHYLSMNDPKALEEERRLCYVGITRAMQVLYMTYAETRRMFGKEVYHRPSRFLKEIPKQFTEEVRSRSNPYRPHTKSVVHSVRSEEETFGGFRLGQEVSHAIFGSGTVIALEGKSPDLKITVRFPKIGTKILMSSFLSVG